MLVITTNTHILSDVNEIKKNNDDYHTPYLANFLAVIES